MRGLRSIVAPLLLALGFIAAGGGSALAASTNNPQWSLCEASEKGKFAAGCEVAGTTFEQHTLGEGEKQEVKGSAGAGTQELQIAGATLLIKKLKFAKGANLKGSKQPAPGTSEATIEFEEVSVKGAPECQIDQGKKAVTVLKSNALKATLAFQTKEAAEKEEGGTLTILKAASGVSLMEFELVGATCPVTGPVTLEGSLALENIEGAKYKESHEYKAPAAAIKSYFVNEAGKTVEKVAELKANGAKAGFILIIVLVIVVLLLWATPAR